MRGTLGKPRHRYSAVTRPEVTDPVGIDDPGTRAIRQGEDRLQAGRQQAGNTYSLGTNSLSVRLPRSRSCSSFISSSGSVMGNPIGLVSENPKQPAA